MKEEFTFQGLDATTDLRGNPLGAGVRYRTSRGSNGGRRNAEWWKDDRSEKQDEGRGFGRSSTASGMGSHTQYGGSITLSGSSHTDKLTEDEIDTTTSPSKPRWSSSKSKK